jgi:hypothetical protein
MRACFLEMMTGLRGILFVRPETAGCGMRDIKDSSGTCRRRQYIAHIDLTCRRSFNKGSQGPLQGQATRGRDIDEFG